MQDKKCGIKVDQFTYEGNTYYAPGIFITFIEDKKIRYKKFMLFF